MEHPSSDGAWDGTSPPECPSPPEPSPCSSPEEDPANKKNLVYHLSDGIYGAFSCLLFDSPCPTPQLPKVRIQPGWGQPRGSLVVGGIEPNPPLCPWAP